MMVTGPHGPGPKGDPSYPWAVGQLGNDVFGLRVNADQRVMDEIGQPDGICADSDVLQRLLLCLYGDGGDDLVGLGINPRDQPVSRTDDPHRPQAERHSTAPISD